MCDKIPILNMGEHMDYTKEELSEMLKKQQMSSAALETLLKARENKEISFTLIDIREVFEFTSSSIEGTDLLLPTSMIQKHVGKFEEMKDEPIVLYCRTGNRTGQVMHALHNMGLQNVVHLCDGIVAYRGKTNLGAKIPNEL